MAAEVRVIYRKHDGSLHWHLVTRWLGEDEHGVWTGASRPTTMRKGDGPPVVLDYASVMLFPRDAWWTAAFNDVPARTEIYCDITTPVQWPSPAEVTMIDLDLDVCRSATGNGRAARRGRVRRATRSGTDIRRMSSRRPSARPRGCGPRWRRTASRSPPCTAPTCGSSPDFHDREGYQGTGGYLFFAIMADRRRGGCRGR